MKCSKCKSSKIKIIKSDYPEAYECMKCKYIWTKSKKALIDE